MSELPTGTFQGRPLRFHPDPDMAPARPDFAIIIPICPDGILLSHSINRGYVVPSGRVEASETSLECAIRELDEEVAAQVEDPAYLGYFTIEGPPETQYADLYAGLVTELAEPEPDTEAASRRIVARQELPAIYSEWSQLLAHVIDRALNHHSN